MGVKKKFITMRIDEDTHDYLTYWSERELRPIANLLSLIIAKAIEQDKEEQQLENV